MMQLFIQVRQASVEPETPSTGPLPPDVDRGNSVIAGFAVYSFISFVVVSLRLGARYHIRSLSWDDLLMAIAWMLLLAISILVGVIASDGGFRHIVYLTTDPANFSKLLELMNVALAVAVMAKGISKISVAMLQLRLLRGVSHWQPVFLRGMILFTSAFTVANLTLAFAQCNPPSKLWDLSPDAAESCLPAVVVADCSIFFASLGAFVDFALALLPATYVWTLNQPLRTRLMLMAVLGCGAFSGVCGAIKAHYLSNFADPDLTWNLFTSWLWAGADIFLVILCGSVPALKPLWDMRFPPRNRSGGPSSAYAYGRGGGGGGSSSGGKYIRSASSGQAAPPYELGAVASSTAAKVSADQSSITPIVVVKGSRDVIRVTQTVDLDWDSSSRTATDVV